VLELQIVSGLVSAAILFLVASGLTLIFGVCHVLNLAHGSFFILASFLAFTFASRVAGSAFGFWFALVLVPFVIAALGALMEVAFFRRLYRADILLQVLPTIAVIYIINDAIRFFWGLEPLTLPVPPGLGRPVEIFGALFPLYYAVIVGVALAVAVAMWWSVFRTDWGLLIRAIAQDRDMATALGADANWIFTSVFALAMWLAGVGGVLFAPIGGANLGSDIDIVVEAFAVVVVGGLGSVAGSAVAAILIGLVKGFGILIYPQFALVFVFALMVFILITRPTGLLGTRD